MVEPLYVSARINAPIEKVWDYFISPQHIVNWNFAAPEWHSPRADNNLEVGGKFCYRMESKDGTMGLDFEGVYDSVEEKKHIAYTMSDGRKVRVDFTPVNQETLVEEHFEPENSNPDEFQRSGWQAILDNFKKYAEKY